MCGGVVEYVVMSVEMDRLRGFFGRMTRQFSYLHSNGFDPISPAWERDLVTNAFLTNIEMLLFFQITLLQLELRNITIHSI